MDIYQLSHQTFRNKKQINFHCCDRPAGWTTNTISHERNTDKIITEIANEEFEMVISKPTNEETD